MTETLIFIRPIVITAQTFTDGISDFEVVTAHCAWGLFINGPGINISGTSPSRKTAIEAANKLVEENGWTIAHIAPEVGDEAEGGRTLQ